MYSQKSTNELVSLWQQNKDENAASELFSQIETLKKYFIRRYVRLSSINDDSEYESIANIAFTKAINTYSTEFQIKFTTHFVNIFKRKIISCWRKKKIKTNTISDKTCVVGRHYTDLSDYYLGLLSPINAKVIHLKFVENRTNEDVGNLLGLKEKRVERMGNESLEKLKRALSVN